MHNNAARFKEIREPCPLERRGIAVKRFKPSLALQLLGTNFRL
jgi:hypothetical protein